MRQSTNPFIALICGVVFYMATPALCVADVASSAPSGFVLKIETNLAAPPAKVYARFFEVGRWWSDAHTYSGSAANMSLKKEPGGCFCEKLPHGAFVRHGAVEYAVPDKVVRISAALGPLQEMGAHGMLAVHFAAAGAGTKMTVSYIVSGYEPAQGYGALAPIVDGVLKEQFDRLKRLTETGKPAG